MKKRMKKATALTLASAMALSMAACGGNSDNQETASTTEDGTPVITFMAPSFYGTDLANENSDQVIEKYEDYTGISVDWQWENNDTYSEKLGLTLMDKSNMPMILTVSGDLTTNTNIVDAAQRGAFWDLSEFLEDSEAYPNLSQYNKEVAKALTVDGQLIGVYRARAIGRYGLSYRTDWAEAVGITEAPQTVEEVYDMLYKFTYNDPD